MVTREVLDHGYVELIDSWGTDQRIIESARMSTNKGFDGWGPFLWSCSCHTPDNCEKCKGKGNYTTEGDEKLLRYLYTHDHLTPFEMCGMTIEVQAPIFVIREWVRHRTFSYNEMSGRYTKLPDLYYVPSVERLMAGKQAALNKQGSEAGFSREDAEFYRGQIEAEASYSRHRYEELLESGMARELARIVLPLNQYSRMRVSGNLRNWLHFLTLRTAPNAQWEIRQFAAEVEKLIADLFPRTYQLWKGAKDNV